MLLIKQLPKAQIGRFLPVLIAFALSACFALFGFVTMKAPLVYTDPDEAMRLVQLRDFLAGQAWRDLVPHRLDPSFDTPMHWSRLVDLSMAFVYWPFTLIVSASTAEYIMAIVWPGVILGLSAWPLASIARRFGGSDSAVVAIILILAASCVWQYLPGRLDHHTFQMMAALLAIAATMARNNPKAAMGAGFATALALSVGIETLPYLVVLACFFARDFIAGQRLKSVRAYAAALGLGSIALFLLGTEPRFFFLTACDTLTINVLMGVVTGAAGLYALAWWEEAHPHNLYRRCLMLATLAVIAAAAGLAMEPRCMGGVMGTFDQAIRPLWLNDVVEVQSFFTTLRITPLKASVLYAFPLAGILAIGVGFRSSLKRDADQIMMGCFAMALLVAFVQSRGVYYAGVFAIPFVARQIVWVTRRIPSLEPLSTRFVWTALAVVSLTFFPLLLFNRGGAQTVKNDPATFETCCTKDKMQFLASMPPGLALAPIDLGPAILLNTPHAVVSAPYHRFDRGIGLGQTILYKMNLQEAEIAIRSRGIDYIVAGYGEIYPLEHLIKTERPDWLEERSPPGASLRIYAVKPMQREARHATD